MTILNQINAMQLRESGNKIHQTDSREFKRLLHDFLTDILQDQGLEVFEVKNALVVEIPHAELGSVVVEIKGIVKGFDYDIAHEIEDYQEKVQAQLDKKAEKERLKQLDLEQKAWAKAQKEKEKVKE